MDFEDAPSAYAEEGTLAHALAAERVCSLMGWKSIGAEHRREAEPLMGRYHTEEMDECAQLWAEAVVDEYRAALAVDSRAVLMLEQKLDMGRWAAGCYGTADAVVVYRGHIHVMDFKYGKGVAVEAAGNTQMRLYALGAFDLFAEDYEIATAEMSIVQPRLDNYSTEVVDAASLLAWAEERVRLAARLALEGQGAQMPGPWCRFCKVRGVCRELGERALALAASGDAYRLGAADFGRILPYLPAVKAWVGEAERAALSLAMQGQEVPGYKVVEKGGRRAVADEPGAMARLEDAGYEFGDYAEVRLKGITELERMMGKAEFARLFEGLVAKRPGSPALVPTEDRRRAVDAKKAADPGVVFGKLLEN